MKDFELWEEELKMIWDQLGTISSDDFIDRIQAHTDKISAGEPNAIADFERACAYDSTGFEKKAEPLYRSALQLGLTGLRRRRARIQLASTLRNNGKFSESIEILREEKENYSDELDDAVNAFLALSLSSVDKDKEALSLVLESLSAHYRDTINLFTIIQKDLSDNVDLSNSDKKTKINSYIMRKIILDLAVTLDGFIEGPNGETDWCIMDDDMNFNEFLDSIDTIFYGRVSYDSWGTYQPEENASPEEKEFWDTIHSKNKYVFSSQNREDENATFINSDMEEKIKEIKKQNGKNIWLYGGASLIKTFIQLNLIDIYRISVHPLALGNGKPLFEDLKERLELKLITTNVFRSGVVQLIYEPRNK